MAQKKPLVIYDGQLSELLTTDRLSVSNPVSADNVVPKGFMETYVAANSGGGLPLVKAVINFDSTKPSTSKTFNITSANVLTNSLVISNCLTSQSVSVTQDSSVGSSDFDLLAFAAHIPSNGEVIVFAHSLTGYVLGQFQINIQVK